MRSILLGMLGGLALGILGMVAYDNYFGEGLKLAGTERELVNAHNSLVQGTQQHKSEVAAMSAQIEQLTAHNAELKHQVDELKGKSESILPSASSPMGGMVKTAMAGRSQQKLALLKSRLHLTPEQEAAVKEAMDYESKRTEEMTAKIFSGEKIDAQALTKSMSDPNAPKSVEQTLSDILSPDQKTTYQQMEDEEKKSTTETMATAEMNEMAPALQLSETQKDQVYTALYQLQASMTDPATYQNNPAINPTNPISILEFQAKAKEAALAKILTPEQLATYHQQAQSELEMQKAMMQKLTPSTTPPQQMNSTSQP